MKTQSIEERLNSLPPEVMKVKLRQMTAYNGKLYVGAEEYKKIQEVIEKYPEHFPQETAYNKTPKEVHEAYRNEVSKLHDKMYPQSKPLVEHIPGEGILSYFKRTEEARAKLPQKPFDAELFFKKLDKDLKRDDEFKRKKKVIWKKHYKKYGVDFDDY
jgi:hypothetical protein